MGWATHWITDTQVTGWVGVGGHKFYKYKNKIDVESSIVAARNSYLVKGQFSDLSIINEDQLDKEFRAFEQNTRSLIPKEEFVMQLSGDVYNKMINFKNNIYNKNHLLFN